MGEFEICVSRDGRGLSPTERSRRCGAKTRETSWTYIRGQAMIFIDSTAGAWWTAPKMTAFGVRIYLERRCGQPAEGRRDTLSKA